MDVTFEKMSGALGSLLLLWSAIERSAREELTHLRSGVAPKPAHGIAAVLRDWEKAVISMQPAALLAASLASTLVSQLREALIIRNGLCHGLTGISAARGEDPAALTWEINGVEDRVTWPELQASLTHLSKSPLVISALSRPSGGMRGRMEDSAENREWWRTEYDLDLVNAEASSIRGQ